MSFMLKTDIGVAVIVPILVYFLKLNKINSLVISLVAIFLSGKAESVRM